MESGLPPFLLSSTSPISSSNSNAILGRIGSPKAKKKGQLVFNSAFESGNIGSVFMVNETEYDISIRNDTNNSKYRVWFYFSVKNVKAGEKVVFNIINFSKKKSLFRDGMTPLVKSNKRPKWERIPRKNVFYYRSTIRKSYLLSFLFAFDFEDDVYYFAYSYPYTYTQLQEFLNNLDNMALPYLERQLLTRSIQGRRVDMLTITSHRLLANTKKKLVFLTARVHPGESPASYVCQGIIEFLISKTPEAKLLRDHIIFKIVPMLNPDGVFLGNYRCDFLGFDLNRQWIDPSNWLHPTIFAIKNTILEENDEQKLDLFIDIHAHSTMMNAFMYGNIQESSEAQAKEATLPKLLDKKLSDFSFHMTQFNSDSSKAGSARRTLGEILPNGSSCFTLEVSFFGKLVATRTVAVPYTIESYNELGKNVCLTLIDYFGLQKFINE